MFTRATQLTYTLIATSLLVALVVLLFPNFVHAFIGEFVYKGFVVGFLGWIMSLAGNLLNYSINTFVIGFGTQFQGGVGFVVNQTWATIRDLFNLTFIFGLVFIGFKMILRTDDSNSRKWLVNIILAALLVNFSLFITKFVIDFSNIVAVEVINMGLDRGVGVQDSRGNQVTIFAQDDDGFNVSSSMSSLMDVSTVFSSANGATTKPDYSFSLIFGTALVFLVTAFVYLSAALMIIIRAAVLVILMILSPFLFIGMVFPNLQGAASKMWKMLITRAMFAPIYIILLYITLSVAGGFIQAMGGNQNFAKAFTSTGDDAVTDTASAFGPFLIIIALLIISLVAAQKLGAEGATSALKMGNNLRRGAQKQIARGAGGVAARSAARGAEFAERNYNRLQTTKVGRYLNETKTGKVIKGATKGAAAVFTLGASTAILDDKNIRGAMKAVQKAKVAGSETLEEQRKRKASAGKEIYDQSKQDDNTKKVAEAIEALGDVASDARKLEEALTSLTKTTKTMSDDEKEAVAKDVGKYLKAGDQEMAQTLAMQLSKEDIEKFEKSGKFGFEEVNTLKETRKQAFISVARNGSTISSKPGAADPDLRNRQRSSVFSGRSVKDAGELPVEVFTQPGMAAHITPQVLEERMRNGSLTDSDLTNIRNNIENYIFGGVPTPEKQRAEDAWRKWGERSVFASQIGIRLP